jgi:hypothetical protein
LPVVGAAANWTKRGRIDTVSRRLNNGGNDDEGGLLS